jgi:hypothetical protein
MSLETMIGISYLITVPYVIWRLIKRYDKTSLDGVIGPTPGFDGIMFILGAPFWTVIDLIVNTIQFFNKTKNYDEKIY